MSDLAHGEVIGALIDEAKATKAGACGGCARCGSVMADPGICRRCAAQLRRMAALVALAQDAVSDVDPMATATVLVSEVACVRCAGKVRYRLNRGCVVCSCVKWVGRRDELYALRGYARMFPGQVLRGAAG